MNDLDFFDDATVDPALFEAERGTRVSFPTIGWQGQHNRPLVGAWTIDDPGGDLPGPFWRREKVQFGGKPNSPFVDAWVTERLRCCILGFRTRWQVTQTTPAGTAVHYYPEGTPSHQRPPGRIQSQLQVAITMPGDPTAVYALGLKGPSKTIPFFSSGSGQESEYPLGVWPRLRRYASAASEQQGKRIPALCTWWVDLVPYRHGHDSGGRDGEFIFITVGSAGKEAYMLPYTADLQTMRDDGEDAASDGVPRTRFVGRDLFQQYQRLHKDVIVDWVAEWGEAYTVTEGDDENGAADGPAIPPMPPDDWV